MELTDIAPTSLAAVRSFQDHDVVTWVNGEPALVITYTRRGVEHTLTFATR